MTDPITFDTEFDSILCTGDDNGEIRLTNFQNLPQYGISSVYYTDPGFLFAIPFDSIIIDSNLIAGTYSYFVEDSIGCLSNRTSNSCRCPIFYNGFKSILLFKWNPMFRVLGPRCFIYMMPLMLLQTQVV